MPEKAVRTINGITYPRDVPPPEGVPEGWKGVEQAYGESSKLFGQTYIRYSSVDGKHKAVGSIRGIFEKHYTALGIPWKEKYDEFEAAKASKADAEKRAKGTLEGPERDEMVALSRDRFGELSGPTILGFKGWKCRWDYNMGSGQTPKTFIDPDGVEYKLVLQVECKLGCRLHAGDQEEIKALEEMVEAGKVNFAAHELFGQGSQRASATQTSCLIDPAQETVTSYERTRPERKIKRKRESAEIRRVSREDYQEHASFVVMLLNLNQDDIIAQLRAVDSDAAAPWAHAATGIREHLLKLNFEIETELILVFDAKPLSPSVSMVLGVYYQKPGNFNGQSYYQLIKLVPDPLNPDVMKLACSASHVYWSSSNACWKIGSLDDNSAGFAVSYDEKPKPFSSHPWSTLKDIASPSVAVSTHAPTEKDATVTAAEGATSDEKTSAAKIKLDNADSMVPQVIGDAENRDAKPDDSVRSDVHKKLAAKKGTSDEKTKAGKRKIDEVDSTVPQTSGESKKKTANVEESVGADVHQERVWFFPDIDDEKKKRKGGWNLQAPPAHWPDTIKVSPGAWVPWLPDGWGQGLKPQPAGDALVFISPTGKICYSKALVEKEIGSPVEENEEEEIPTWPAWLPTNWAITTRLKVSTVRKRENLYITPGGERALYNKEAVEKYIAGTLGKQRMGSDGRWLGRLIFPPDVEQRFKDAANKNT